MTLCIAAPCLEDGQARIVFASDKRIESGWASAEVGFKLDWVGMNWPAMYAGSVSGAQDLIKTYSNLTFSSKFTPDNVFDSLRQPAGVHKHKLCDHYVRMKLGIAYGYFLEHGKQQLSDTQFRETEFELRELTLDCQLVMAGYIERRPYVFTLDESGTLIHCDNFATIGSGSVMASSVLYHRQQGRYDSVHRTIYVVYEAMKMARIAPGVGTSMVVLITSPPNEKGDLPCTFLKMEAFAWLDTHLGTYGPKEIGAKSIPPLPADLMDRKLSTPKGGGVPSTSQT